MRIKNDTSFEIHFGSADDRCMLQAPPDELLQANHDWKGDIITKTHDECEDRGAKFILLIEFSAGGADGEWQKPPGSPWRVVNKEQDGLCIVEVGSALDVSITPEPQSGCH